MDEHGQDLPETRSTSIGDPQQTRRAETESDPAAIGATVGR